MSVSGEIIKVLDALAEKFGIAVDWTSKNVVPYLEQLCGKYINYEIATSIFYMLPFIGICIIGIVLFNQIRKNKEFGVERYSCIEDDYTCRCLAYVGVAVIFFLGIFFISIQIIDIITCYTFPEKIILEEITEIYNSMKY